MRRLLEDRGKDTEAVQLNILEGARVLRESYSFVCSLCVCDEQE